MDFGSDLADLTLLPAIAFGLVLALTIAASAIRRSRSAQVPRGGTEVLAASMATEEGDHCQKCIRRQGDRMQLTGTELGWVALRRVCRHLEWVIMMFVIAHIILGGVFLLYGLWVLTAMTFLGAAAWCVIGLLLACALNAIAGVLNETRGTPQ